MSQRSGLRVRLATEDDLAEVCKIVNYFIEISFVNFRTEPQGVDEWRSEWRRLRSRFPWLVATDDRVVGVAYAAHVERSGRLSVDRRSHRLCRSLEAASRGGRRVVHRAARPAAPPRVPQRRSGDRAAQRAERPAARTTRVYSGWSAGRGRLQNRRLARRRFLAMHGLVAAATTRHCHARVEVETTTSRGDQFAPDRH